MQSTVAKRYAAALHSLAQDQNTTQLISQHLQELARIWQQETGFSKLMTNPRVDLARKRAVLTDLGAKLSFDQQMANLINLLLDKGRIDIIPALAQEYRQLDDFQQGRARAKCVSANTLSQDQLEQLQASLTKITGAKEVLISLEVDPSLLAGIVVSVDGRIIDGSLKGRLQRLRHRLASQKQQD